MDEDISNAATDIEPYYRLVLRKLFDLQLNSLYLMDEFRYVYSWDSDSSSEDNLKHVMREDAALTYFINSKTIDAIKIDNTYRDQELARRTKEGIGVWSNWDEVDPAYREYDYIVLIYSIDNTKLHNELERFHLIVKGTQLIHDQQLTNNPIASMKLPSVLAAITVDFCVHENNVISYRNKAIELENQASRIIAHILMRYTNDQYTSLESIIDNCLSEVYLENAAIKGDEKLPHKYVRRYISDARKAFRNATNAKNEKDFFPNKTNLGYTFDPS